MLRNLNFSEDSQQMGPQIDNEFLFIDFIQIYIFGIF